MEKKKLPIPVNSPESFAICKRKAMEERKRLGKTTEPLTGKVRKKPHPRTKATKDIVERIDEMTKAGLSIHTTATALGISDSMVQRIRKKIEEGRYTDHV